MIRLSVIMICDTVAFALLKIYRIELGVSTFLTIDKTSFSRWTQKLLLMVIGA